MADKRVLAMPKELDGAIIYGCLSCPFFVNDSEDGYDCNISAEPMNWSGNAYDNIPKECPLAKVSEIDLDKRERE